MPARTHRVPVRLADWLAVFFSTAQWRVVLLLLLFSQCSYCCGDLLLRAELWLMLACWRPAFLYHCRWATCGPVGGGAEVMGADWLAPVWVYEQPGRKLQCIYTACTCYTLSVRPKEFACLLDCDWRSLAVCMTVSKGRSLVVCLTAGGSHNFIHNSNLASNHT
jgi:hypothetical protein